MFLVTVTSVLCSRELAVFISPPISFNICNEMCNVRKRFLFFITFLSRRCCGIFRIASLKFWRNSRYQWIRNDMFLLSGKVLTTTWIPMSFGATMSHYSEKWQSRTTNQKNFIGVKSSNYYSKQHKWLNPTNFSIYTLIFLIFYYLPISFSSSEVKTWENLRDHYFVIWKLLWER